MFGWHKKKFPELGNFPKSSKFNRIFHDFSTIPAIGVPPCMETPVAYPNVVQRWSLGLRHASEQLRGKDQEPSRMPRAWVQLGFLKNKETGVGKCPILGILDITL